MRHWLRIPKPSEKWFTSKSATIAVARLLTGVQLTRQLPAVPRAVRHLSLPPCHMSCSRLIVARNILPTLVLLRLWCIFRVCRFHPDTADRCGSTGKLDIFSLALDRLPIIAGSGRVAFFDAYFFFWICLAVLSAAEREFDFVAKEEGRSFASCFRDY